MRASFENLARSLGVRQPPRRIWQQPFDPDAGHYNRLCRPGGAPPDGGDLVSYALDLRYQDLQPDLLRFLLPLCLRAWRESLFAPGSSPYGGFVEHFSPALAARADLESILGASRHRALSEFMGASILDRMDTESSLRFSGMNASPYKWFAALGSCAVIFAGVEALWHEWWRLETPGHACAALQYLSCLMYPDDSNPIFSPWTPLGGGGAPHLAETDGHIYDVGWRAHNIAFVQATLSVEYFRDRLYAAVQVLAGDSSAVPQQMAADFESQQALLELRIEQLPALLSRPACETGGWIL